LVVIPRSKFNETNHDQAKLDRAQDCHLNKPDPNIIAWIIEKWGLVSYRLKHKRIESACQEKRTPKKTLHHPRIFWLHLLKKQSSLLLQSCFINLYFIVLYNNYRI
jgi:hypothetical protein